MDSSIEDYTYSKQFILIEDNEKKLSKSPYAEVEPENIDDYLYTVVTSVTQKVVNGSKMHFIQHEDREAGWIELQDSIQIFRFTPIHCQVIEDRFQTNELNQKMNIDKDFISHFKGKLLTVKSQVSYKGEKYYSVFLKNKFHGFHNEKHLDPLFDVNLVLTEDNLVENPDIYMISNLTKPVVDLPALQEGELISVFPANKIVKIKYNKNFYWLETSQLKNIKIPDLKFDTKSEEQLMLEDIFHAINAEREKSKEMVKSVLSAKDYLSGEASTYNVSSKNSRNDADELAEEINTYKSENLDLKRQLRKTENDAKLTQKRLEHQYDYKERLEEQRDKYKSRMKVVEEKLKNLDEKYKDLRDRQK